MADNQLLLNDGDGNDIFVYTGGRAPRDVRRAKIDESIDIIPVYAFLDCKQLTEVQGHKGIKKIEEYAFFNCVSLRRMSNMNGVIEIKRHAIEFCYALSDLDFDKLEIIGFQAFFCCKSLVSVSMPSVRRIGQYAFRACAALSDAVFCEDLESIERNAFWQCPSLGRIAIPLKHNLIVENDAFDDCGNLLMVDVVVGGIQKTISSFPKESWRNDMMEEIGGINEDLSYAPIHGKTPAIQRWIRSVLRRMDHYKSEHRMQLKEAMALLELALWKTKLLDEEEGKSGGIEAKKSKKAKIDVASIRKEHRVTCGASMNVVIKNVLPFLALE